MDFLEIIFFYDQEKKVLDKNHHLSLCIKLAQNQQKMINKSQLLWINVNKGHAN